MKKSTLIVLALAIIAGAAFYFFDWKKSQKDAAKVPGDTSKPAFTFQPDQVTSITITRPAEPGTPAVVLVKQGSDWKITQPIATLADGPTAAGIAQALANARIAETQPGAPDRLKVYGLEPAAVVIDFQLQNGAKHTVQLGKKDFVGTSVYSKIDTNSDVSLLPESLLGLTSKSLDGLRDRAVLHAHDDQIVSFELKNPSGEIDAAKEGQTWKLSKPTAVVADRSGVDELLAAVTGGKMILIASETPENLAKFGLAAPAITFTATDTKGKSATLVVGKMDGDNYFAREQSLPIIFTINADLEKKLSENFSDLRDKKIAHVDSASISHIDIQNSSGTISLTRKNDDEWTFDAPPELKGKSASAEKLFSTLEQARADEVIDKPSASIAAKFTKPAFEAVFTSKDGKKLTITVSSDSDGIVYARNSESATAYKLKKQFLDDLNLKATDLAF
ncbi:MAG: DUF4340 domain-containing protein [Candidatus Acidiferrales bacterium]